MSVALICANIMKKGMGKKADIKGNVVSIKNPKSGNIIVDSVGEIINEDSIMEVNGKVIIRKDS